MLGTGNWEETQKRVTEKTYLIAALSGERADNTL